ncbi:hypothetical protein BKA62DRAFT_758495 [Auriculariales sp. MPI-PUGE-AT-0066]|nr:hypothetical protein BKA62DRAFT_758495 [Auriculariales sp. MPI-PUGE-AT-0066]
MFSSYLPFLALALPPSFRELQFRNASSHSNGRVWSPTRRIQRESLESDFTAPEGALAAVDKDWAIQTWLSPPTEQVLGRQHVAENVLQWPSGALGLKTSAYDGSGITKVSEIDSKRNDILYGTFRTRATVPSVPGVCFDSDYSHRAHYTNQPGNIGDDFDPDSYHSVVVAGADFTGFGEHRFDWVPGQTSFYYNSALRSTLEKNLMTNLWSNGNPHWTMGPPTEDAIALVQYIKAYFTAVSKLGCAALRETAALRKESRAYLLHICSSMYKNYISEMGHTGARD